MAKKKQRPKPSIAQQGLEELASDMKEMFDHLSELPDDVEWTEDELAALEAVRYQGYRVSEMAEATNRVYEEMEERKQKAEERL